MQQSIEYDETFFNNESVTITSIHHRQGYPMANGFQIRPAQASDGAILACVAGGIASEFGMAFVLGKDDTPLLNPQEGYRNKGGECWIVEARDTIVGSAGLMRDPLGRMRITHLFLAHDLRGLGIGGLLIDTMLTFAQENNAKAIWALLPATCDKARPALIAKGFQEADPPSGIVLPEGSVYLQYPLTPA